MDDLMNPLEQGRDVRRMAAIDILNSGRVPANEIDKRPGPGGKTLSYIKHTYGTRLMQDGFGPLWSFECLDYQVFHDELMKWVGKGKDRKKQKFLQRSIVARCKLTITYPIPDTTADKWHKQVFTEIGAFEPNEGMSTANGVGSAVSRGLMKCMMRALGIGLELYEDEAQQEITPKAAWNILKRYLQRRDIEWTDEFKDQLTDALDKAGISSENIVEKFNMAYSIANEFLEGDEEIPM